MKFLKKSPTLMLKTLNHKLAQLLMLMLPVVVAACSDSGCIGNSSSIPLAAFYDYDTGAAGSIGPVTIRGIRAPGDSCLVDNTTVNQVYLPLQASAGSSTFVFDFHDDELPPDTLTLRYEAVPYFHSSECGVMYLFNISGYDVTDYLIDSIALPYQVINNEDKVTIKLYF